MKKILILFLLFQFHKSYSQVDSPIDTAGIKGLKTILQYEKQSGFLKMKKQLGSIKEFDREGKIVKQQIFVNRTDIPEFENKFYYNEKGKIIRRDYLMYDENKKDYVIEDSTFYFYSNNNLDSIKHYNSDRLDGATFTYQNTGKIVSYWRYDKTNSKIDIYREDDYNSKGQMIKNISQRDTNYYFYDQYERDSVHYFVNIGKPHSLTTFTYSKREKIEHVKGILFPKDTFDKKYCYNKRGKVTSIKYKLKDEKSAVKNKYYSNGLLKQKIVEVKKKSKSESFRQTYSYIYEVY
jgi:antitoxin component YwqK of YwqJK toxin-antitoxin module